MDAELLAQERQRAISAHALYLANLLLLPGVFFGVLWWCRRQWRATASPALRQHLDQAFGAAVWSGVLIILICLLLAFSGGLQQPLTWVLLILYFTVVHAALILFGAYALSRAMAGLACRYPLPGLWRQS